MRVVPLKALETARAAQICFQTGANSKCCGLGELP